MGRFINISEMYKNDVGKGESTLSIRKPLASSRKKGGTR